jgi:asparagine synthase (glutamine-hydrolysing)
MCGIAGVVTFSGIDHDTSGRRLAAALTRLSRRGPDGEGRWSDAFCMLGHRRLAIVDLSEAGRQPMMRGPFVITFNGMIYNYRELHRELQERGERFTSNTDTEILLAGWRFWGVELLQRLDGMFSFAIWDGDRRRLTLVRDRFGKKPLYWKRKGAGAVFASDLRSLQTLDGARGRIRPDALSSYLALRYVPEPLCILEECSKVAPGGIVEIDEKGIRESVWYQPCLDRDASRLQPKDRAPYIRHLVERATKLRLIADVPVGAFLSGGIDSAVVAAASGGALRTFTIGFDGVPDYYEERPFARATARHIGTEHVELSVAAEDAISVIDDVFDGLDEPFADSSAIPTFLVSQAIRSYATVALSGDGGDEVFGGYRRHQGELFAGFYRRFPAFLRSGLIEMPLAMLPEGKGHSLLESLRRARRFTAAAGLSEDARHAGWMRATSEAEVAALGASGFDLTAHVANTRMPSPMQDAISRTLFADLAILLPSQMLAKVDRMSMANAIEVRSPLLDHHVVEAALAFPPEAKVAYGYGKAVLRDAFADALPPELFRRSKKGFELPVAHWLRSGPWRALAEDAVDPASLSSMGLAKTEIARQWLAELDSGRRDTADRIWVLVALRQWMLRQSALSLS